MSDRHVVALYYKLKPDAGVEFKAAPLEHTTPEFSVRIENLEAKFTMTNHHASIESARSVVEQFTRAWTIRALVVDRCSIEFEFDRADRDLGPGEAVAFAKGSSRVDGR